MSGGTPPISRLSGVQPDDWRNSQPIRNQKRYAGVYEGTRPSERHRKAQDSPQRTAKPIVKFTIPLPLEPFIAVKQKQPLPLACPAFSRTTGATASPPGIRSDIAQSGGFCKREARGVDLRPRPSRRAQQGPLRQSEIASCTQKRPSFGANQMKVVKKFPASCYSILHSDVWLSCVLQGVNDGSVRRYSTE